jgi:Dolichyl-phosphate-mannose-protein mannosyltransferase
MDKIVRFLSANTTKLFPLFILLYLILILPGLATTRSILCDESWYSNTGYNFSIGNGFFNTNVGVGGNSNYLFPLLVGISFKIFGVSIFAARIVAVVCGVISLFVLRAIYNLLEIDDKNQYLSFLVCLSVSFLNSVFRYARPECLSITLLLVSIYFYLQFLTRHRPSSIIWCGLFLSLGFLAHPFVSVFILVIGFHFLYLTLTNPDKNFTTIYPILIFGGIVILSVISFLMVDSYYNHNKAINLSVAANSLLHRTVVRSGVMEHPYLYKTKVILHEWFLSKRIIFSLPLLLVSASALFFKNRIVKSIAILGFLYLIISFIVFQDELQMSAYIYIYFMVISLIIMPFIFEYKFLKVRYLSYSVFSILILVNLVATVYNNHSKAEYANLKLESDFKTVIPEKSKVFAPIEFWFPLYHTTFFSNVAKDNDRTSVHCPSYNFLDFDYLVFDNDLDTRDLEHFKLIYNYQTVQYGLIRVYQRIK